MLRAALDQRDIDFDGVIAPQLGAPFVLGLTRKGDRVGAIRVRDAPALRRDVEERLNAGDAERLDDYEGALVWRERRANREAPTFAALHDRELVVAQSRKDLEEAIDAARGSENLAFSRTFTAALAGLDGAALVRAVGDAGRLLSAGDPGQAGAARAVPWVRALGLFTLAARVEPSTIGVEFRLATTRVRLSRRDLPLSPGTATPRLHDLDAAAAVAVLAPQRLVRFLEQSLRATDPARFARYETGIEQLRSIFGVDVRRDLLDEVTSLSLAARSATDFTFVGTLKPGAGPAFARNLARALPFVEGVLNDVAPGTSVEARGSGTSRIWVVTNNRLEVARYAVRAGRLVGSVGLRGLPRPVAGRRPRGIEGSLVLKGDLARVGALLGLVLDVPEQVFAVVARLGDLTLGVRTSTRELSASGRISLTRAR